MAALEAVRTFVRMRALPLLLLLLTLPRAEANLMLADLRPERDASQAPVIDNAAWQEGLRGRTLRVDVRADRVRVRPSVDDRVHISGIYRSFDDHASSVILTTESGSQRLTVTLTPPADVEPRGSHLDVYLRVPRGARLELTQQAGSLAFDGVEATIDASVRWGRLYLRDGVGDLTADVAFGDLDVAGIAGSLSARVASGGVAIGDVCGDVALDGRLGEVAIGGVAGELRVDWPSGRIGVADVGGDVAIRGGFARIAVHDVRGRLELVSESGDAIVGSIAGDTHVITSHGAIRADRIGGDLRAEGKVSDITLHDIAGAVQVRNTHGDVSLDGLGGAAAIEGVSVSVDLRGFDGAALTAAHRIRTSYGDVRLAWPGAAEQLAFDARVEHGRVDSAFEARRERNFDSTRLVREVTSPTSSLDLDVRSGDLRLTHEPPGGASTMLSADAEYEPVFR